VELRLQASTHGGVPRWKAEVEDHTGDVEPRPTDEDGVAAALMDLLHGGAGKRLIPGDSRLYGGLTDIEQTMRDAAPLGDGQLGGADVHAAIQLHGIRVDDLRRVPEGPQPLGDVECVLALACAGGADDGPQARLARGCAHTPVRRVGRPRDTARGAPDSPA